MAHIQSFSQRSRSSQSQKHKKKQVIKADTVTTCLYIGNIDKRLSQQKLKEKFLQFGGLEYCFIVYEPHSTSDRFNHGQPKQSRGYGFAKYKTNEEAGRARQGLTGLQLNGRKITVQFSKRNQPRQSTPGRYLGKKRSSPIGRKHHSRRSYSRSSSRSRSRSHKKSNKRPHEKKRRHNSRSRSRSNHYKRRRQSYSRSPQKR